MEVELIISITRFTSLNVQAVMPVLSAKPSGIFSRVLESIFPAIRPLAFSNICRIRNSVAPYIQQIVSMFWITPPVVFNLRQDTLFIFKQRTFESTSTTYKYKTILMNLTLSRFALFCCHYSSH